MRGPPRQAAVKPRESHVSGGRDPAAAQNEIETLDVARAGMGQNGEKQGNPPFESESWVRKVARKPSCLGNCPAGRLSIAPDRDGFF